MDKNRHIRTAPKLSLSTPSGFIHEAAVVIGFSGAKCRNTLKKAATLNGIDGAAQTPSNRFIRACAKQGIFLAGPTATFCTIPRFTAWEKIRGNVL
jgi:hypothetical protein